jgi:hypothetical protein
VSPGRTRRALLFTLAAGAAAAAYDPAADLAIENRTNEALLVRHVSAPRDIGSYVEVFEVPARTFRWAIPPAIGSLDGTLDIVTPDCGIVGQVQAQGGSVLTIDDGGAASIAYRGDVPTDPEYLIRVAKCGGEGPED